MTELDRYNILELLLIPRTTANETLLWTKLDAIQLRPVLETEVLRIANLLIQADTDPSVLLPTDTIQETDPALIRADVVEWSDKLKADESARLQNLRDALWLRLKYLIPWDEETANGLGFGFS